MIKPYDELTFTDDFLFSKIMRDETICKTVIELLLDIQVDKIEYLDSQSSIDESPENHGVRLDVYLKDSNRIFDIEIQTTNTGNLLQRARYYQSMIDIDFLKKGEDYSTLKESYVIFLCTFDPFNKNLCRYTFKSTLQEIDAPELTDKTQKIFYNVCAFEQSQNKNIQAFLKFLATTEPTSDFTKSLAKAVFEAKGRDKWRVRYMTLGMKFKEYREEGRVEGAKDAKLETAKNLLKLNLLTLAQISTTTGLSLDEINKLNTQLLSGQQ